MTTLGLILFKKNTNKKVKPKKHHSSRTAVQRQGKIFQYPILFCLLLKQYLILHKKLKDLEQPCSGMVKYCQVRGVLR